MTRTQKIVIGVIIGVLVCLFIAGAMLGAAVVGFRSAVRAGDEEAATQSLKAIGVFESQYYNTHGQRFGTFEELIREGLLDQRFRGEAPVVDGYVYTLTVSPAAEKNQPMYTLTADPRDRSTGTSHFYRDSSSDEIRVSPDHRAGPSDAPIKK